MCFKLTIPFLSIYVFILSAKKGKRVADFPIDFKSPFYSGKFYPCKETRPLNPVEVVRARAWATDIFTRCGSKLIIHFATKCNIPAVLIESVVYRFCLGAQLAYAYNSINNGNLIQKGLPVKVALGPVNELLKAMLKLNYTKVVKRGKTRAELQPLCFLEYVTTVVNCALGKHSAPVDIDFVKHVINYYKFLVL